MKSELDIKMMIGAMEELLKTHVQECKNLHCITHVVLKDRIDTLERIVYD